MMGLARAGGMLYDFVGSLPEVENPEDTFAGITRQDYNDYINNFRGFEERLISLRNDDSLRQRAVADQRRQNEIAQQVQARNAERYGGAGLSAAQRQEQQRALQRGGQLGITNTSNNARVQQRQINNALIILYEVQNLKGHQALHTKINYNLIKNFSFFCWPAPIFLFFVTIQVPCFF